MIGSSPMCSSTRSQASQSVFDVDTRLAAEAFERLRERLARDSMQRQRERIHRAGDQIGAGLDGRERSREARAGSALAVEADR